MTTTATVTATDAYANLATLIAALSDDPIGNINVLTNGFFRCAVDSSAAVRISVQQPGAETGSDGSSNILAAGEYLPFDSVSVQNVWIIGDGGTLEIVGDQ